MSVMESQDLFQCARAEITQSLLQLRNENCLTDLELECELHGETVQIAVHGVLFAARSKYFKALLSEPWCTHGTRRVTSLVHIPICTVQVLVDAVYTGYLSLCEETMLDVLLASLQLDFTVFASCATQVCLYTFQLYRSLT